MVRTTALALSRPRTAVRAVALGALVLGLAAGCGSDDGSAEAPAVEGPGAGEQQDASDGGGAEAGTSDDATSEDASDDGAASDDGGAAEAGGAALPEDADLATEQPAIGAERAVEIGLEAVGGGELVQIEIDHDDDVWEWELEILQDRRQHDVDIDATSGEVTQHEQDDEDDDDRDPAVDVTSPMTPEEAIEIALGKELGRVSGWDLDSDDDRVRYTVDITRSSGKDDVEVEVGVETGEARVDD